MLESVGATVVAAAKIPMAIPVPPDTDGVLVSIGPFAVRYYAVAILIGIVVAMVILEKRYTAKGGPHDTAIDVGIWAVVLGIIGARVYYVVSTPDAYFGPGGDIWGIFRVWEGGLAIIGGLIGGAIGIYIGLHKRGLRFGPFVDSLAPALLVAQAIGRFGNYFNQELFGTPTDLPWGLSIDAAHMPAGYPAGTLFHPTFLYEQIWNICGAIALVILERKLRLRGGQVMAGYFMVYGFGRFWIEMIRTDFAHSFGGLRFNSWAALCVFIAGAIAMVLLSKLKRTQPQIADIFMDQAKNSAANADSARTADSEAARSDENSPVAR
ncbi:MAG: prolipoprotein diacylglyceryl transferase [Arcanobacterium sp.]|nr:prolipoprotein diacylglyceryl transferase [Arcanobacterium sp.]